MSCHWNCLCLWKVLCFMQILLKTLVWNIPHEHDLPKEVAVNTTDPHRQRSLWFSSPCVQKLHESLLKCCLPTTVVTGEQTKCISDPLKRKKQNAICTLEPRGTRNPVAWVMKSRPCSTEHKSKIQDYFLFTLGRPQSKVSLSKWPGPQCKADLLFFVFFSEPIG